MKTIVRLEYTDGNGVFRANNNEGARIKYHHSQWDIIEARHDLFPTPWEDTIRGFNDSHYCAFKSIEQLQQWLTVEEIKEFITLGFKVLMLDVHTYLEGEYQICFKKEDILQSKDISSLFV